MASVTQAGNSVISNDDFGGCGWVYTPAQKGNQIKPAVLARSTRAKPKRYALQPATHSLTVTICATEAETDTFRDRLDTLYESGNVGTLSVPGFPNVPQTIFTGQPGWSEQKAAAELGDDGTLRYLYDITLELMEL